MIMPLSILAKASKTEQQGQKRDLDVKAQKIQAFPQLNENIHIKITPVWSSPSSSRTLFYFIFTVLYRQVQLVSYLNSNSAKHTRGMKSNLTREQDDIVLERLLFASRCGFAADVEDARQTKARVAVICGNPYIRGTHILGTAHLFRAKLREISYRKYEFEDNSKVNTNSFDHLIYSSP